MNYKELKLHALKSEIVKDAQFVGKYDFPMLKYTESVPKLLVPFDATVKSETDKWLHFYIDDYKFERVWNNPKRYVDVFKKYSGIIGFDFSLYSDMPVAQQIWNIYRNRALSHYFQENNVKVIPNIQWGDESTYKYCFDGIPIGGTVAVSTNGAIGDSLERYIFKKGLSKMLRVVKPKTVVVYSGMPEDIFGEYRNSEINFIQFNNYNDVIRGRCHCNG